MIGVRASASLMLRGGATSLFLVRGDACYACCHAAVGVMFTSLPPAPESSSTLLHPRSACRPRPFVVRRLRLSRAVRQRCADNDDDASTLSAAPARVPLAWAYLKSQVSAALATLPNRFRLHGRSGRGLAHALRACDRLWLARGRRDGLSRQSSLELSRRPCRISPPVSDYTLIWFGSLHARLSARLRDDRPGRIDVHGFEGADRRPGRRMLQLPVPVIMCFADWVGVRPTKRAYVWAGQTLVRGA